MRGYLQKTGRNLASLRKLFVSRARDDASSLEKYRAELVDEESLTAPARIKEIAHGLAGSGGIFDFPNVSVDACALEDAVSAMIDGRPLDRLIPRQKMKRTSAGAMVLNYTGRT